VNYYTFTPEDRELFAYWVGRIPSGGAEEALFNALALKQRHDMAGLYMTTRGLLDLSDRQDERTRAILTIVEEQSRQMTTLAAEFANTAATLSQAVVRLDHGMSIVESLQENEVSAIHAAIGAADADDPRTIRQHLRDQDVDRAHTRRLISRIAFAYAVLALFVLTLAGLVLLFGTPAPVFGAGV
jgi:hypothetical protein